MTDPPPHLSSSERDALYEAIVVRLTGIDTVHSALEQEDWVEADRLASEFSDLLRLIQDLGWGERGTSALLSTPPDVLRRALSQLKEQAEIAEREEEEEQDEIVRRRDRAQVVVEVCSRHLPPGG
jgi:hypothetical protein